MILSAALSAPCLELERKSVHIVFLPMILTYQLFFILTPTFRVSMWMCSVHILLGISLMVLMGLTAAEPLKMAMFSPKKKLKVGALFEVGINVHMRNTLRVFFRVKTWARNPGCSIRVKLGSDGCLLMLILAPHCH